MRTLLIPVAALAICCAAPARLQASPPPPCPSAEIHIYKARTLLELRCAGEVAARYPATFGKNPRGHKVRRGDERTPEGRYHISSRVAPPRFHRFLGVSYPSEQDRRRARARGVTDPGDGIGIHGTSADKAGLARLWIWFGRATGLARLWGPTDGCIALRNEDVEALYARVRVGTPVQIDP